MQEYTWKILGNVRRPVWTKYGEQGNGGGDKVRELGSGQTIEGYGGHSKELRYYSN